MNALHSIKMLPLTSNPISKHSYSQFPSYNFQHAYACKASKNNYPNKTRRDILISLTSTASGLNILEKSALSAPIMPPDFSNCTPSSIDSGTTLDCCPPNNPTIIDFTPPPSTAVLKVRPAAHLVSSEYAEKYKRAVALMKALPANDPRNFTQQANIHCAYCDGAYHQIGFPNLEIQVHFSWLFFPWHRCYLYFHERILSKLIGDETFALPYWNWDSPNGMNLPAIYTDQNSSLYDSFRDALHQPPALADLDYNDVDQNLPSAEQIDQNLKIMYRQVISNGKTPQLFMGSPYRAGQQPYPGPGSFENTPHGPVHAWTGDRNQPMNEDMGVLYAAARDPIFFAHHSNIDRVWNIWKGLGGMHQDFTDNDWLDTSFLFYNEDAQIVRIKVRDCLSSDDLRYTYQEVDNPWLSARPQTKSSNFISKKGATTNNDSGSSPVSVTVKRPRTSPSKKQKEEEEEVLVVDLMEFKTNEYVKVDVYVNALESSYCAGSFVNVPHAKGTIETVSTKFGVGINDLLDEIGAEADEMLNITLIPRCGTVKIGDVKVEYSSLTKFYTE